MQDPEVRIDTIGVAFPIVDFERRGCTVSVSGYMTNDEQYRYRRKLDGGGFLATGVAGMAWVEASLPKRIDGENVEGVTLDQADELVEDLLEEAAGFVEPDGEGRVLRGTDGQATGSVVSFSDPKIVRLDLVRDFKLRSAANLSPLLDGLSSVPRVGRTKVRRFADGERNQAQTLTVGPKAWKATLYDKHIESNGLAAAGSLRFEARLHGEQLQSVFALEHGGKVGTLADLDEDRLRVLRRGWFERAGFDREVVAMDLLWDRIVETDLSARERATFIGWCDAVRRGRREDCGLGVVTERKYRNVAARLGITLERAEVASDLVNASIGLDYDQGCERILVAA